MKRHKVDTYIDASIATSGSTAFGVCILFNGTICCEIGVKAQKNVKNSEVAELHALQRGLGKLYGNPNQTIMNSDITLYIDNSSVLDYFTLDKKVETFPQSTINSCEDMISNILKVNNNNTVSFKKIARANNKAHELAYNAATKGIEKKGKSMGPVKVQSRTLLKDSSKKLADATQSDLTSIINTNNNLILCVIEILKKEAIRISELEAQLDQALNQNIKLKKELSEAKNSKNKDILSAILSRLVH